MRASEADVRGRQEACQHGVRHEWALFCQPSWRSFQLSAQDTLDLDSTAGSRGGGRPDATGMALRARAPPANDLARSPAAVDEAGNGALISPPKLAESAFQAVSSALKLFCCASVLGRPTRALGLPRVRRLTASESACIVACFPLICRLAFPAENERSDLLVRPSYGRFNDPKRVLRRLVV